MSLLMDALRKAEEEKNKAAQARPEAPVEPPQPQVSSGSPAADDPGSLSLEPLDSVTHPVEPTFLPDDGSARADNSDTIASQTMVQSALQEYFDATRTQVGSQRQAPERTRPPSHQKPIAAASLAPGDITSPTVQQAAFVGAHTIFNAAGGRRPGKYVLRIALGGMLLLILSLAGAAYYYYLLTPASYDIPLAAMPQSTGSAPRMPVVTEPPVSVPRGTVADAADRAPAEPPVAEQAAIPAPATVVAPSNGARSAQRENTTSAARSSAANPVLEPVDIEQTARLLRISRRTEVPPTDNELAVAYAAWQRGDLVVAEAAYRNVLGGSPDHRDALLGLAAIAVRGNRLDEAYALYRAVLRVHPGDNAAAAGLFAIDGGELMNENVLKSMREEPGGVAHVHFVLGSRYAREQRWAEAQQAFFDAFSGDGGNPDYAYNLAVSLDHLGQRGAALDYYRKALELGADHGVTFQPAAVRARIAALQDAPR